MYCSYLKYENTNFTEKTYCNKDVYSKQLQTWSNICRILVVADGLEIFYLIEVLAGAEPLPCLLISGYIKLVKIYNLGSRDP